jgi:hypothetical protein
MNKNRILFFIIILFGARVFAFDYPIKPGTEEWKQYNTRQERVERLQIPTNELGTIETVELAKVCVNYPFYLDPWAYDQTWNGMKKLVSEFNGFSELFVRNDAFSALADLYNFYNPKDLRDSWSNLEKGEFALRGAFLELLISLYISESRYSEPTNSLLKSVVDFYEQKIMMSEVYDILSAETCAFLAAKLMIKSGNTKFLQEIEGNDKIQQFLKRGRINDFSITTQIIKSARDAAM